jgi:hypothetical protein
MILSSSIRLRLCRAGSLAPFRGWFHFRCCGQFGAGGLPVKGLRLDRRLADDAVALADGVVEAGQLLVECPLNS